MDKDMGSFSNIHHSKSSPLSASQVALVVKKPPASAGDKRDADLTPGLGRSPGGGRGNPLQYACLENPHGQRSLAGYKESDTTEQLSTAQGRHKLHLLWE